MLVFLQAWEHSITNADLLYWETGHKTVDSEKSCIKKTLHSQKLFVGGGPAEADED